MRLPRLTTRRWMLIVALVAIALTAIQMTILLVNDARQKAADERWSDPYLRAEDQYEESFGPAGRLNGDARARSQPGELTGSSHLQDRTP